MIRTMSDSDDYSEPLSTQAHSSHVHLLALSRVWIPGGWPAPKGSRLVTYPPVSHDTPGVCAGWERSRVMQKAEGRGQIPPRSPPNWLHQILIISLNSTTHHKPTGSLKLQPAIGGRSPSVGIGSCIAVAYSCGFRPVPCGFEPTGCPSSVRSMYGVCDVLI